ncbi:MAG: hypothetical protein ACO1TE_23295 [Prosthecobacter sp.]
MKFNLPKKPPGDLAIIEEPSPHPPLLNANFYRSADESAARRQAIMTRLHEKRAGGKSALRMRGETARPRT